MPDFKKQHYVRKSYLKNWTSIDDKNNIWTLINNEPKKVSLKSVGQKSYFYKFEYLNPSEFQIFKWILKNTIRKEVITLCQKQIEVYRGFCLGTHHTPVDEIPAEIIEGSRRYFEFIHTRIEKLGDKLINEINSDKIKNFNVDDFNDFIYYICLQYTRTNFFKNRFKEDYTIDIETRNVITKVFPLYSYIFANNLAFIIQAKGDWNFTFLKAPKEREFITSDQPIINLGKEDLILYFPLSPGYALILNSSDKETEQISSKSIDVEELDRLNLSIKHNHHLHLFSNNPSFLLY
jgi:hypothetical protein